MSRGGQRHPAECGLETQEPPPSALGVNTGCLHEALQKVGLGLMRRFSDRRFGKRGVCTSRCLTVVADSAGEWRRDWSAARGQD